MGSMVEWLVYHDMWSKMQIFSDLLSQDADPINAARRDGPKNMLDGLRLSLGKTKEGAKNQLYKWVFRQFVTYSAQTGLYTKTQEYLQGR